MEKNMTPEELLEILHRANMLKINTRHNWTIGERKESVADHSWRIALMAMLISKEDEFDLGTLDRYRKDSFFWYKKVIATNGEDLEDLK